MKAVILAGGKGVRLRPLTYDVPKAMLKIGSKPILQRIVENLKAAGITEALMIVGYKKEVIEDFFGEEYKGIKISYFLQKEQLGTAHALSLVEGFVQENFLVLNADVLVESHTLKDMTFEDEFDPFDAVILARHVNDPWRYGCLLVQGNEVKDIIEKPAPGEEPSNMINAGVYRFGQSIFEALKQTDLSERSEFELIEAIKILIKNGKKVGYKNCAGICLDIGDQSDLKRAQELIED